MIIQFMFEQECIACVGVCVCVKRSKQNVDHSQTKLENAMNHMFIAEACVESLLIFL